MNPDMPSFTLIRKDNQREEKGLRGGSKSPSNHLSKKKKPGRGGEGGRKEKKPLRAFPFWGENRGKEGKRREGGRMRRFIFLPQRGRTEDEKRKKKKKKGKGRGEIDDAFSLSLSFPTFSLRGKV